MIDRRCAFLILVVWIALLGGCGVKQRIADYFAEPENPPTPLETLENKQEIVKRLWKRDIGANFDKMPKLYPVIDGDRIFVASADGRISALNRQNGRTLWRCDIEREITGGIAFSEGQLIVATEDGDILAHSAEQCDLVWRTSLLSPVLSRPVVAGAFVMIRSSDNNLFALDFKTGEKIWNYDRLLQNLTLRGTSAPVVTDNLVIAGFDGGYVVGLDLASGLLIWEYQIAASGGRSELDRIVDIDSQPKVYDDFLYVAAFQGNISLLFKDTGQALWQKEISTFSDLEVDNNYLYVSDVIGQLFALDSISGEVIWSQDKLKWRTPSAPAGLDDWLFVGDFEGYLHILNKRLGDIVGRLRASSDAIYIKPVVHDRILYIYASDGVLSAYELLEQEPSVVATDDA